jgi:serine/threonine-protein kinase
VIKTIRPERARDPAALSRFEREVRILATLTHPNTVAVFDYGYTADGTFYYAMEYLPGLDLDALVDEHGPLPAGRAVHLLRQVCGALREAHAAGLIHRDIKPGNVMVCRRGGLPDVAKLLDFGLVQTAEPVAAPGPGSAGRLTTEGAVLGTPSFMSPEQAAGRPLDPRSDVYSLGAMAFFLLTGKPPFERDGVMETIAAHLVEPPRPPRSVNPDVPADLDAVVLRCLAKDPRDRFATVAELDTALRRCAAATEWDESAADAWWDQADRRPR